jgi:hypothetical protein
MAEISSIGGKTEPLLENLEGFDTKGVTGYSKGGQSRPSTTHSPRKLASRAPRRAHFCRSIIQISSVGGYFIFGRNKVPT